MDHKDLRGIEGTNMGSSGAFDGDERCLENISP